VDNAKPNLTGYATETFVNNAVSGKLSLELLWENASPDSEFAEQTISFNWNGCDYFIIEYQLYIGTNIYLTSGPIKVGTTTRTNFLTSGTAGASGSYRDFHSGTKKFGLNTRLYDGITNDQKGCIPVKIYGVKGVPA
jgi:hypothetical protein